ncbi:carboxymuconolactone decarboxylase family protein [Rhodococcus sp. HNM0569]|uniref:carboxymuconolactone decarboxylase family protein n=1 Tax=Rhodococcus sp. HNM0569 TaxID=2716340 RepID=UPI00146AF9B7|nr:carboxymuconolactone decarboxylase family protein [Rhodococcus sp. HNM0569]NLU83820.1 carboxymuconolactone decarboxylase family protein [Rhodococcus sp. HNM0569]
MARIAGVAPQDANPLVKLAYKFAQRRYGVVPEPFAVSAHHPKLFFAAAVAELADEKAATVLPSNVREIAVYRVAWTVGCSWCVDFGAMLQRLDGLDIERLRDIADYRTSPHYSDDERAAIAFADAMTATPTTVTDEQVSELVARFGTAGAVELAHEIGLENQRARTYSALGITDQGFSTDACRVPWATDADVSAAAAVAPVQD